MEHQVAQALTENTSAAGKLCGVFSNDPQAVDAEGLLRRMIAACYPDERLLQAMTGLAAGAMAGPAHGLAPANSTRAAVALAGAIFADHAPTPPDGPSPAEAARDLVIRRGPAALGELSGVFSLICHDPAGQRVILAVDRYGFAPLFYATVGRTLLAASELKAIAAVASLTPDPAAHGAFFYVGHMLGNQTLFREVRTVGPGEFVEWNGEEAIVRRYWDLATSPAAGSRVLSVQDATAAFSTAVQRRIQPARRDTLLLSGGLDSRLILASLLAQGCQPRLVTLEHAGFRRGLDSQLAVLAARAVGLESDVRPTQPRFFETGDALEFFRIGDGMVPTFGLFISQVYSQLSAGMARVWEGLALDLTLGGYPEPGKNLRSNLRYVLSSKAQNERFLRQVFRRDWAEEIERRFAEALEAEVSRFPDSEDGWVRFLLVHRKRRRIGAPPNQVYSRKVQALSPGIDAGFLDVMLAAPLEMRRDRRLYLELLRAFRPELLRVPVLSGETFFDVQDGAVALQKHESGVAPQLRRWLKGAGLAPYVRAAHARLQRMEPDKVDAAPGGLMTRFVRMAGFERDIYNRAYVEKALRRAEAGSLYWQMPLAIVFYTELWQHIFDRSRVETLRSQVFNATPQ